MPYNSYSETWVAPVTANKNVSFSLVFTGFSGTTNIARVDVYAVYDFIPTATS